MRGMQHCINLFSAGYHVEMCSAGFTGAFKTLNLKILLNAHHPTITFFSLSRQTS